MRPVDLGSDGLFLCGLAHYPKPIDESIAQAQAAAARAATVLAKDVITLGSGEGGGGTGPVRCLPNLCAHLSIRCSLYR